MLVEALVVARIYEIQRRKERLDLAELAILRWVEMWSIPKIAKKLERSTNTIDWGLQKLKKGELDRLNLDRETKSKIKEVWWTSFHGK
ncbi:MAG: hypothetical protein COV44_10955 [Deltaproteobacteria bacterium CG11_big_fil_rev_8_21_14_0_20_45_16]|nr:MAG: hypothetical protein COV44_10955 [Deltaproteobacteria bacterium CG11_big_fil_rev_8_21_14_0_20_45_16]